MALIVDMTSWVLLLVGGFFVFTGGLGAVRMPNLYTRMHGASLTDTLGTILVLLGLMLQAGWALPTAKLVAILVLLLITGPTATYALANAALLSGIRPEDSQEAAGGDAR